MKQICTVCHAFNCPCAERAKEEIRTQIKNAVNKTFDEWEGLEPGEEWCLSRSGILDIIDKVNNAKD